MTPPPRPLSPTRKATSIPSRRPPLRRRKLRLWMRPYSVPRFWRMIDDGEKRPTLPPPHLFDLWITILASRNIPYLLTGRGNKLRLYVPALLERQARSELEAVLAESRKPRTVYIEPPTHNNAHWVLSVLLLLILWHGVRMHWGFLAHLPGLPDLPSEEWSRLGSLDVFRVKTFGEWYRCVTALTLHADSQHLFGNVLFGAPFLILLCRRVGLGLGLFLILLAGTFGNASTHGTAPPGISASASPRPFSARWACFPDSWPFKGGAAERRAIPESSPGAEASSCWPQARASSPCSARKATKRITPHTCSDCSPASLWEGPQAGYHGVQPSPLRS